MAKWWMKASELAENLNGCRARQIDVNRSANRDFRDDGERKLKIFAGTFPVAVREVFHRSCVVCDVKTKCLSFV